MRRLLLLSCLLLAACDNNSTLTYLNKDIPMNPMTEAKARLKFNCVHEAIPEPSAEADVLFQYARWLQKNNQFERDLNVDIEIERLYRIAAENGHSKANINLQNGSRRGHFQLSDDEHLRLSKKLIDTGVATGYYFIGIFLKTGSAGLKQDREMSLRYLRMAADKGSAQAQFDIGDKLEPSDIAPEIAFQMYRCAGEQGHGKAATVLGMGRVRRGRRSQQVLAVSLYTALREPEDRTGAGQLDALLGGVSVFKAQPTRQEAPGIRHSRLPVEGEQPEELLLQALTKVFADLAPPLLRVSEKTPLALLREIDSSLSADTVQHVWQQAWEASGIRQPLIPVEGSGLTVLDKWLDHHITDPALLVVVALQIAPSEPQGTAEAAVGLLLGNRLTQGTLPPMAYLHRPEQEREPTTEALRYAVRQALDWVPVTAQAIERVWRAGIDTQRDADIATVLSEVAMPAKHTQGLCDLDALLGQPGKAAPWLAMAAATCTVERGAGAQFIFSGDGSVETGLWSTVLMPVPAPSM